VRPLKYIPAVAKARQDILKVAKEMKAANLLDASTDAEELVKRAWLDLPGVTDEWIKTITVEKIAGGGDPPKLNADELAALINCEGRTCCNYGCCGELTHVLELAGSWTLVKPRHYNPEQPNRGDTTVVRTNR